MPQPATPSLALLEQIARAVNDGFAGLAAAGAAVGAAASGAAGNTSAGTPLLFADGQQMRFNVAPVALTYGEAPSQQMQQQPQQHAPPQQQRLSLAGIPPKQAYSQQQKQQQQQRRPGGEGDAANANGRSAGIPPPGGGGGAGAAGAGAAPRFVKTSVAPLVSHLERETDQRRINMRQRQIDIGKNTVAYARYLELVPKAERELSRRLKEHPVTPDPTLKASKRGFDGLCNAWRRQLHFYDTGTAGASAAGGRMGDFSAGGEGDASAAGDDGEDGGDDFDVAALVLDRVSGAADDGKDASEAAVGGVGAAGAAGAAGTHTGGRAAGNDDKEDDLLSLIMARVNDE